MFAIDLKSRKSISEQIVDHIKELIVTGVMEPGEKMPSVRDLAGELTVNPNTVQKAFAVLELEGLIVSKGGSGSVFTISDETVKRLREELFKKELGKVITSMKAAGISLEDAVNILKEHWEEEK